MDTEIRLLIILEREVPLQSYIYLKCNIIISNNKYLASKFLCDAFNRKQDLRYTKKFGKGVTTEPPSKLCPQNLHQRHLLNRYTAYKFCTIPCYRIRDKNIKKY